MPGPGRGYRALFAGVPVAAALFAAALVACDAPAPPGLELAIDTAAAGAPEHLVVFLRVGDGAQRAVGARPVDLAAAGLDAAGRPVVVALDTPERLSGSVAVYVVACEGPATCISEAVWVPECTCRAMAVGAAVVDVGGASRAPVTLVPFDALCDADGDLFPDCERDGCCDGLPPLAAEAVHDCDDTASAAHPFRGAELPGDPPLTGLAAERHRAFCGDGLDNDCRAEPDVPCVAGEDADGDGVPSGPDCDDGDPEIRPGAVDICGDGIDQDCDGRDAACDRDRDGSPAGIDCDDSDPGRSPNRLEVCGDGIDQDCDMLDPPCVPDDVDGDGVPCPEAMAMALGRCIGPGLDCDDLNAGVHPGAAERCGDGVDQDCDGLDDMCPEQDADGDGSIDGRQGGVDCDDAEPTIHPGAPERCDDGIDQDCDGADLSCAAVSDQDGDGWPTPGDCNDARADIHPYAEELCDGVDGDCDGIIDEGNPLRTVGAEPAPETCGDPCPGPPCACRIAPNACLVDREQGTAEIRCLGITAGARVELCNGIDDDCDGLVDEELLRPCYDGVPATEGVGLCVGGMQRCTAAVGSGAEAWGVCEGQILPAAEACSGQDEDCDGAVDRDADGQPIRRACYPFDTGMPGAGPCRRGQQACDGGGFGACAGAVGPGVESCNGVDDDCDGTVDGLREQCYTGPVGTEGIGICHGGARRCDAGAWSRCAGEVVPADSDVCDGRDNDCDARIDEDFRPTPCNGSDVGRCETGSFICQGNRGVTCQGAVLPRGERCDAVDDDCDGLIDEGDLCRGDEVCVDGRCEEPPDEQEADGGM